MDGSVIVALLLAALLHSSWHAMIKAGGDGLAGLAGMNVVSSGIALAALPFVAMPPARVWPILAVSVGLHAAYKLGLARVYKHGDLSVAYPIARGLSPIFATAIALVAIGETPGYGQLSGVGLISGGLMMMGFGRMKHGLTAALLGTAAATGFTVAAYSVVDAYGTRMSGDWLSFTVWLMALDGMSFVAVVSAVRGSALWRDLAARRTRTFISGMLGVVAFSVFLWALSRGPVGGVSALRETSVLFASLIGVIVLKERWSLARFAGAVLITLGIITFSSGIGT